MYNQSFLDTVKGQNLLESISDSLKRIADGIERQSEFSKKSFEEISNFLSKINDKESCETNECVAVPDEEDSIQTHYFDDEGKLKVKLIAAEICEEFEDFLDENGHIMIPDSQREGNEDEALLYGETYDSVEDEVLNKLSEFFDRVIHEGLATAEICELARDIFWNIFMPVYDKNKPEKENEFIYISADNKMPNISYIISKIAHYLVDTAEEDFYVELNKEEY